MRKEVKWFAEKMEETLKENDYKKHWSSCGVGYLFNRLQEEVDELDHAINQGIDSLTPAGLDVVIKECGDVANYSMMMADNAKRLKAKRLKAKP